MSTGSWNIAPVRQFYVTAYQFLPDRAMKENREFSNGLRVISDALFVKDNFLPVAIENEKWNVVVSEAHRAVELLMEGLIYLMGGNPRQRFHNLEGLVQKFEDCLAERRSDLPFNIGYYSSNGDAYGIRLRSESISVARKINNIFTLLINVQRHSGRFDEECTIGLELDELGTVSLKINETIVASVPVGRLGDSPLVEICRQFDIRPRSQRFIELKRMGQFFTHGALLEARYSKREFMEREAKEAICRMGHIFEISNSLVSIGN
jgi:HEPN domain-containing protein